MVSKIRALCADRGIRSLNVLEEMSGIGKNTVYRWDENRPNIDNAAKVAATLGVTLDELLQDEKEGSA